MLPPLLLLLPPELPFEPPLELAPELLDDPALVAAGVLEDEPSELFGVLDVSLPPLSLLAEALSEPPSEELDPVDPEPFLPP